MGATRFHWLDACRFFSAFAVLASHARASTFVEFGALPSQQKTAVVAASYALTRVGTEAVTVFFVLSGFLVGGLALERARHGAFCAKDYGLDRATRVLIPLLPALALTAVVTSASGGALNVSQILGNAVASQGILVPPLSDNIPLWSLAYEVWFYVLILGVGIGVSRGRMRLLAVLVVSAAVAAFWRLDWSYLACMGAGVLARSRLPDGPSVALGVASLGLMALAAVALQLGSETISFQVGACRRLLPHPTVSRLVLGIGSAVLIRQLSQWAPTSALARNWESLSARLAAFSYTLYLTHYPLLRAIRRAGLEPAQSISPQSVGRFFLVSLVCVAAAWSLYVVFEKQTGRVRRWVRTQRWWYGRDPGSVV